MNGEGARDGSLDHSLLLPPRTLALGHDGRRHAGGSHAGGSEVS